MIPEGWELRKLGELCSPKQWHTIGREEMTETGYPVFGANGFIGRYPEANHEEDTVVITCRGATCGEVTIVPGPAYITGNAMCLDAIDAGIVSPTLLADLVRHAGPKRLISGSAQPQIIRADVRKFEVLVPPVADQPIIEALLKHWDRAIETVEALIANARAQKQALMQQLLPQGTTPPKKRLPGFSGEWRKLHVGDVAKEVSERAGDEAAYPVLSCSKYDGMVESLTYFKKKVYSDDTSNYKVMRRGTFGFPSNHIEEGSIGYQDLFDAGIVSPIYCVFAADKSVDDGFLYKLLKSDRYRQIFAAATNASVDRRGSLRWKEFARISLLLPPMEEQQAISEAVNSIAATEAAYENQLTALRQEKAALMQQLLTGKRRVKLPESDNA